MRRRRRSVAKDQGHSLTFFQGHLDPVTCQQFKAAPLKPLGIFKPYFMQRLSE